MSVLWRIAVVVALTSLVGMAGATLPLCDAEAQGGACASACKAEYGSCYKSTQNRAACEARLQQCLAGCTSGKRG